MWGGFFFFLWEAQFAIFASTFFITCEYRKLSPLIKTYELPLLFLSSRKFLSSLKFLLSYLLFGHFGVHFVAVNELKTSLEFQTFAIEDYNAYILEK